MIVILEDDIFPTSLPVTVSHFVHPDRFRFVLLG